MYKEPLVPSFLKMNHLRMTSLQYQKACFQMFNPEEQKHGKLCICEDIRVCVRVWWRDYEKEVKSKWNLKII